jgi:hypothetical protein
VRRRSLAEEEQGEVLRSSEGRQVTGVDLDRFEPEPFGDDASLE